MCLKMNHMLRVCKTLLVLVLFSGWILAILNIMFCIFKRITCCINTSWVQFGCYMESELLYYINTGMWHYTLQAGSSTQTTDVPHCWYSLSLVQPQANGEAWGLHRLGSGWRGVLQSRAVGLTFQETEIFNLGYSLDLEN